MSMRVSALFDPEPQYWGLRGDPHLWRALRQHLASQDMPGTVAEVMELLRAAFAELTGADLTSHPEDRLYREQYAHGGMSGGWIDLTTWREKLMPAIAGRAAVALRDGSGRD
jgi:hypothetical protein